MAEVTLPDAASVEAAGAVMDSDFAGSQTGALVRTGAGAYAVIRDNDAATAAPGVTNDTTEGYSVGSRWTDTVADQVYFCADASTGAAVWRQIGSGGGGGAVSSVFGRTGAVAAAASDYDAAQVDFAADGDIAATNVQAAIVEVRDDTDTKLAAKADTAALTAHTGNTANPHATDIANLGTGTLAELNGRLTDAALDDAGAARTPTSHAATHVGGGADAIPVAIASGAAGLLSGADKAKLDGIESGADVTDAVNVAAAGALMTTGGAATGPITSTSTFDGRDVSADGAALDGHIGSTANPHGTDLGNLGTGTHAELNATVTDRDLVADATKLDGVEAAADVTDAANVAAAGALMTGGGTMTGALNMGANAITTTTGTVDGRDVSADGATLDAHVAAANPHSGSLGTAHEGAGGAVHASAVASGAAGFMSGADKAKLDGVTAGAEPNAVDSVFGRTGAVAAQAGDYTAAQVTGAVQVGGQLGGAAATPDVRGLRTTEGGGTLLTLGSVADGEYLLRSGATIVGGTPAGGGGGASIDGVEGVDNAAYWSETAADPLTGSFTLSAVAAGLTNGAGFDRRYLIGTFDGTNGVGLYLLYDRLFGYGFRLNDNGGTLRTIDATITNIGGIGVQTFLQHKLVLLTLTFNSASGLATFYANGTLVEQTTYAAGAITAGANLTLGASSQGSTEQGLKEGLLHGGGYATRELDDLEVGEHFRACVEASQFESVPGAGGDWTRAWRVDGGDPGATWAPFVGTGSLTRTGTPTYRNSPSPQWR